jgi:hypothetical protein
MSLTVPSEKKLNAANFNRAIGADLRYIHFPVVANKWGTYRNHYTPKLLPDGLVTPGGQSTMLVCNRWWQPTKSITVWSRVVYHNIQ